MPKQIRVTTRDLVITGSFGRQRRLRILDSKTLLSSLMVIKSCTKEENTKTNIDTLIAMILDTELDH